MYSNVGRSDSPGLGLSSCGEFAVVQTGAGSHDLPSALSRMEIPSISAKPVENSPALGRRPYTMRK